jgi:hypothetical protein
MSRAPSANDDVSNVYGATALGPGLVERIETGLAVSFVLLLQEKLRTLGSSRADATCA